MKKLLIIVFVLLTTIVSAQSITILPTMSPEGGSYEDKVMVSCTFPEGCAAGIYWFNGAEITAQTYERPIEVEYTSSLSVAGVNAAGRIITDVVTKHFDVVKVTPPWTTALPKEGVRKESFYVTKIWWQNIQTSSLRKEDFKENGPREGEPVVWLTDSRDRVLAYSDYNGIWENGLHGYKLYLYKNYNVTEPGEYVLHVAKNVFVLDGELYDQELQLHYEVSAGITAPEFSPEPGEYADSVEVSITYPEDGAAFYRFYKINGGKTKNYVEPFFVTETSTITAWGVDEDYVGQTEQVSATYTILESAPQKDRLDTPIITREGNTISISAVEGATIKYWMNDSMQTAALYTAPFDVKANGRVSAVAYTESAISLTADIDINDFPVDRGDYGDIFLLTPANIEEIHLTTLSENGRFAAGYVGSGISSRGVIWDLMANQLNYIPSAYINQLLSISDEGLAYGWTTRSLQVDESSTEDDLLYGVYTQGGWQEQPATMRVNGLSAAGWLFGSESDKPALYDVRTGKYIYLDARGELTAVSEQADVLGGYVIDNGAHVPAIWKEGELTTYPHLSGATSVTDLSPNGEWALMGQCYRVHITTGEAEYIIQTNYLFPREPRAEHLNYITNDGTLFGTHGALDTGRGLSVVYTPDGRWRRLGDWLTDEMDFPVPSYNLLSMCGVNGSHNKLLVHVFPLNMSSGDSFTRGLYLGLDVQVAHLAPSALTAEQMKGSAIVKLSWQSPLMGGEDIVGYTLLRDGETLGTFAADVTQYYDEGTEEGKTYSYVLTATYKDGTVSEPTYPTVITVASTHHLPVLNLRARRIGVADLKLTWDVPALSIPKLQYFREEESAEAFGTAGYNSEWGIRIPAEDMAIYKDQMIRTFQFLPTGKQESYRLNLYRGIAGTNRYEAVPYYSQQIDTESLVYGRVNTIFLTEPQALPESGDLYVTLYIEGLDGNMLGVQYDGFRSGYTDLCRVEGVHDAMVAISTNSESGTIEIVLPLGIGVCDESQLDGKFITNYIVRDNDALLAEPTYPAIRLENVSEGEHTYSVQAMYQDGEASAASSISVVMQADTSAFVPIQPTVSVNGDVATIRWQQPRDDDRKHLGWGNLEPTIGFPAQPFYDTYAAEAIYPMTLTDVYADQYEITGIYFYPMAEATFLVTLTDGFEKQLAYFEPQNVRLNEMNYLTLRAPLVVNPANNYTLTIDVMDAEVGTSPLAYDSSNKWEDGMSNILYLDGSYGTLLDVAGIGEHPNWLMGLMIHLIDSKPLPVDYYDVYIDGEMDNTCPLEANETTYPMHAVTAGEHTARVDVTYFPMNRKRGKEVTFRIGTDEGLHDTKGNLWTIYGTYDLLGRPTEAAERGVYIINGEKVLR